jgi:hypothetical protein
MKIWMFCTLSSTNISKFGGTPRKNLGHIRVSRQTGLETLCYTKAYLSM